jgi:hypothetical protein
MVTQRSSLILLIIVGTTIIGTQTSEFVEQRPKKNSSLAKMKEQCCERSAELLKEIPTLLHAIANIQRATMALIEGYWESDKQQWCNRVAAPKLHTATEQLHQLREKMRVLSQQCELLVKEITTL